MTSRPNSSRPALDAGGKLRWLEAAACRSYEPSLFFPVGTTGPSIHDIEKAKSICGGCPVRAECLQYAMDTGPQYGIFGGLTEDERQTLRRRQPSRIRARHDVRGQSVAPVPDPV